MVKFPFSTAFLYLYTTTSIVLVAQTEVLGQAIQPDATLPSNSVVNQAGNNYTITGGTTVGGNLFHSFSQFSVPNFGSANFNNATAIANIISRVTGNSVSDIQGLITANGTANLFLINPNGIIFGPNAALDIGGSFVASTADSIEFVGGGLFSAKNPSTGTLLTMTAPLGLQMGSSPGTIQVQGFGNNLATDPDNFEITKLPTPPFRPVTPLVVNPGETLALVGGDIVFDGGNIQAVEGRVELGAFSNGQVGFTSENGRIQLTSPIGDIGYNNIDMRGASSVDVSGNIGGSVQVQGRNLSLTGGSVILANTTGGGVGGDLKVTTTETITVSGIGDKPPFVPPFGFAQDVFSGLFVNATSSSTPSAQAGHIQLNTGQLIVSEGGQIGANTFGAGQAGRLTVNAQDIQLSGESLLPASGLTPPSGLFAAVAVNASGRGGKVTVNTNTLQLSGGANINVGTFGMGDGGVAIINASDIDLTGISPTTGLGTGIFGTVEIGSTGNGGNLLINTGTLTLRDGAAIGVNTRSSGDGGFATINASDIEVIGNSPITGITTRIFGSIERGGTGNGGSLLINTDTLTLRDGGNIAVNTFTSGNAGSTTINASNVSLTGNAPNGNPTGIFSNVENDATGNGGNLRINTGNLQITDGAQIGTLTLGSGNAGSIDIQANVIDVQGTSTFGPSSIVSQVGSLDDTENDTTGNGGEININTNLLSLQDGGIVSTNTIGLGEAGNITVNAQTVQVIGGVAQTASGLFSAVLENGEGNGGSINLNTDNLIVEDGGQIVVSTAGFGNGGNLDIVARSIELSGDTPLGASGLFANAINSTGDGGSINIKTDHLGIHDGATINVGNFPSRNTNIPAGEGAPGNINIEANTIVLDAGGTITADTLVGSDGNIVISTNSLSLGNNSIISTNAEAEGSAGNIRIGANTQQPNISLNQSRITSNGEQGNLTIEADNLSLDNSLINAEGNQGNIEISSNNTQLSNSSTISTNAQGNQSAGNITVRGRTRAPNISLNQSSITSNGEQGNLTIEANKLTVDNQSLINAEGNQGNIDVNSDSTQLSNNSAISTNAQGEGSGGSITIKTNHLDVERNSTISSNAQGNGSGGTIGLNTNNLNIRENSRISANAEGSGSAGNIIIEGRSQRPNVNLNRGAITASGEQGNLSVQANNLTLDNSSSINTEGNQGNIEVSSHRTQISNGSDISSNAQGNGSGGNITLKTNQLTLDTFSNISANAEGTGSAGNITITRFDRPLDINLSQSNITATGNQGNIRITSENLLLDRTSGISANAEGNGDGGNVTLINNNDLTLKESSFISTDAQGVGRGGNIELVTDSLNILSNSEVTANASATSGGNINIQATSPQGLTQNTGTISATGGQGNITITSPLIFFRNGSLISTNGLGTEPGGNINIKTDFLLSFPTENSDITANAQQSQGGRVIIDALGVFGIEFRDFLTPLSDITVTSELGPAFSGEVLIRVPEGDPTSGFNRLPENTVDPRDLIVIACAADEGNVFIRTGKGGIPDNPEQPLRWRTIWEDLRDLIEVDDDEENPYSPRSDRYKSFRSCTE